MSHSFDRLRTEYGEDWQKETARSYLQSMVGMYQRHEGAVARMWGTRREFTMGPRLFGELLQNPAEFSSRFFERVRRLNYLEHEDVYIAGLKGMARQEIGKQAVFVVVTKDVETAIDTRARFVCLQGDSDDSDPVFLSFAEFERLVGDGLTWLGDGMVLTPPLNGALWAALVDSARQNAMDLFADPELLEDLDAEDASAASAQRSGVTAEQWDFIAYAPIGVFMLVASADGTIDDKEIKAFQTGLVGGVLGASDSEVMQKALLIASENLEERLNVVTAQSGADLARMLAVVQRYVRDGIGPAAAAAFADALLAMGEQVAKASGGGFLGLGSKIGKEEKQVLAGLRELLDQGGADA